MKMDINPAFQPRQYLKKQKIRPGDILGAVAGESGMNGDLVGTIDMYDKFTFVEVPKE